jgi:hypothetical protein
VEVYRRLPEGGWRYVVEEGQVPLPCVEVSLDLEALYQGLPV